MGQFATLRHQNINGRIDWVTEPEKAPTALAALVARLIEQADFRLLSRDTVMHAVAMNRADGTTQATLYQALFTDSDIFP